MDMIKLPEGAVSHFTQEKKTADILFTGERQIADSFEQMRMQDFCVGRYCAHQCLTDFNRSEAVLKTEHGEPIWPKGLIGSISHSKLLSGAVVMPEKDYKALGLDIEAIGRVSVDLWPLFFTEDEIDWLQSRPYPYQSFFATLFFSFKEAFYKMQFSITKSFVDYHQCIISYNSGEVSINSLVDFPAMDSIKTIYSEQESSIISMVYC